MVMRIAEFTSISCARVELHSLTLIGYCLMSNHIHLIVTPGKPDSLARVLKDTHGRYAAYWNATHHSSGHVLARQVLLLPPG
jgi:putative transposase